MSWLRPLGRLEPFGLAWAASGAQGFFGEGYWWHKLVPGLSWKGATFVAKTTTLTGRLGNMPLNPDWSPRHLFPDCVRVNFMKGAALNAVGLSGPGLEALLDTGRWQERTDPFFVSFMTVETTKSERIREASEFSKMLGNHLHEFRAPLGIQVNLSCPNTGLDPDRLAAESTELLAAVQEHLGPCPLVAKINVLVPVETAQRILGSCDGLCVSNTIPWAKLQDKIRWPELFPAGTGEEVTLAWDTEPEVLSPLRKYGGGGLSGSPLLPLVAGWIRAARDAGVDAPINAGGGILSPQDASVLFDAGADSVSLGTIAMLRGWRLRRTIRHVNTHH